MSEITVAQENAPTDPNGFSQGHPLLGIVGRDEASTELREFADALGILPTVRCDSVSRPKFHPHVPAGWFTDPAHPVAVAAVKLSAAMGTRRRRAMALMFQHPGALDIAETASRKVSEAQARETLNAWVRDLEILAGAVTLDVVAEPEPVRKPRGRSKASA